MEIKMYLNLLQKRWWVVLLMIAIVLAATTYFTLNMQPVYQSKATYIVRLSPFAEEKNVISALNTLTSRTEIAATYAGVANSSLIKNRAAVALGLQHRDGLSVTSQMESGTNILEIMVEGNDPALVRDYTNAIGAETVSYVESLYETYRLELLDEAILPRVPIRPNVPQNLVLGGILGFMLGVGLILFMEYLKVPFASHPALSILDQRVGIYDMRYFKERLHQEMSRSRRHKGNLSVALVNIDHRHLLMSVSSQARLEAMRSVIMALGKSLRDEDVMASVSETELAFMLPELDPEKAKIALERILAIIGKVSIEVSPDGRSINLNGAAGVAPFYGWDRATTDVLIARARTALDSMRESTYGRVMISTEGPANTIFEDRKMLSEEIKKTFLVQEQFEVSEQGEMMVAEDTAAEVQELPAEETVAVLEQPEVSMMPVEEPDNHDHHGKNGKSHKPKLSDNGHNKLELSEES
jgi:diguanylate cyclase (GGDEF)-like protein